MCVCVCVCVVNSKGSERYHSIGSPMDRTLSRPKTDKRLSNER